MPADQVDVTDSFDETFEALIASCLERIASEGEGAVLAICREHPQYEAKIREFLQRAHRWGFLGRETPALPADGEASSQILGDFRILRELGRGGMGVVYLAEQISLRRQVALKVLPAHITLRTDAIERFKREASTAARLHHPGIVEIHAVGSADGCHYFAMAWIKGSALSEVLAQIKGTDPHALSGTLFGKLVTAAAHAAEPPPAVPTDAEPPNWHRPYAQVACSLIAQVAESLHFAHQAGVVHRDVKPSNILVRPDGTAVLTDFGLAREQGLPSLTITGEFAGTPCYVSPEQAIGKPAQIDHRTDIYSLGITLYELLTLQRPFDGPSSRDVLAKIIGQEAPDPRRWNRLIPRDLLTIVRKAIEKDPARRYADAASLAADLRAFLKYHPISARPTSRWTRVAKLARRHRALSATAAVVLLTGLVLGSWWWRQPGHLLVTTVTPGATVYIDGEPRGHAPLEVALAHGIHRVRLERSDEQLATAEEQVLIGRGATQSLDRVLASQNGVLKLESEPAEARVTLYPATGDAVVVPQTTPTMFAIKAGRYQARFELDGFPAQERSVEVEPGGALTAVIVPWATGEVRLEGVQEGVRIELQAGAEIVAGASPVAAFTLPRHEPLRLPPGTYSLVAELKGHARRYYERDEALHVITRQTTFKTVWLRPFQIFFEISGEQLLSVSAADLDGDGTLEILAATQRGLAVFDADGSRRFVLPTSGKIAKFVAADVNGDGQVVIFTEDRGASGATISCVGADGSRRFTTPFAEQILDVAAIDFHGDGELLVVVSLAQGSERAARIACLRADGSVVWERPLDGDAKQLLPADLDGDGTTEVIAVAGEAGSLVGLDGSGRQCFEVRVGGRVSSCQAVDLDGDGACQLAVTIEGRGFTVFEGSGTERFARRGVDVPQLVVRDLDGDGKLEIIGVERHAIEPPLCYLFVLDGDGSSRARVEIRDLFFELQVTRGNPKEADPDIFFVGGRDVPIRFDSLGALVLRVSGAVGYSRRPPKFLPMVLLDIDGDGRSESMFTPGSQIVVFGERADVVSEIEMPQVLKQLSAYDLDGNGASEIVALTVDGTLKAYRLEVDQQWAVEVTGPEAEIVSLIPFNASGSNAVVAVNSGGRIAAFAPNGSKLFERDEQHVTETGDYGLRMHTLAVAELDQDDQPEIVAAVNDVIVGLHANGEKIFETQLAGRVLQLAAVDLDHDQQSEIVAFNESARTPVVGLDAGGSRRFETGGFCTELVTHVLERGGPAMLLGLTHDARIVTIDERGIASALVDPKLNVITGLSVADLDGDGTAELIVGVVDNRRHRVAAWRLDGSPLFATPVEDAVITTLVVDLDHDQRPEIIAGTASGLVVLRNDGSVVFARTTHAQVIDLANLDLDDDGVSEVVAADWQGRISAFTLAGKLVWSTAMRSRVKRLIAADLDGDGRPELVAGDGSGIIAAYAPRLHKRAR